MARILIAALSSLLVMSACGSQHSEAEFHAAYKPGTSAAPAAGEAPTATPPIDPAADAPAETEAPAPDSPGAAPDSPVVPVAGSSKPAPGAAAPRAGVPTTAQGRGTKTAQAKPGARGGAPTRGAASAGPGAAAGSKPKAPAAPAGAARCAGSKATIVIGTVGTQSGVVGASVHAGVPTVQAWAAQWNAKGGLDCHPIKYIVADDGGDPARHQNLVKQLVEREGVIAFVYFDAPVSGQSSVKYLSEKQIPVVGSENGSSYFYDSPMHFPQSTSGQAGLRLQMSLSARALVAQGKSKVATLVCTEATYCQESEKIWSEMAQRERVEIVFRGRGSLTQPDFTSQCLGAQKSGAESILVAFDPASIERLINSCKRVNYSVPVGMFTQMASAKIKDNPNAAGSLIAQPNRPWFLSDTPAVVEYQSTLKQFAPGLEYGAASIAGWVSAKLFELAVKGRLSDTPTSADVLKGLWAVNGNDLGGLTYPLHFSAGQNAKPVVCGWTVIVGKGKFESDGKIICP